jgi:hypothetical protein
VAEIACSEESVDVQLEGSSSFNSTLLAQFCVQVKTMVALALNPLAEEFTPCGAPPGLMGLTLPVGPPGVHTVVDEPEVVDDIDDDILPPPGLTLAGPPGLSCPPGLELVDEEEKGLATPPGKFAPPGNFTPASPPGVLAAAGPPGFFVVAAGPPGVLSTKTTPPGVWTKDSDAISSSESTDADSDSENSLDGSFSE